MSVLGFNAALEKQPSEQITVRANFTDVAGNLAESGYGLNQCDITIWDNAGANQTGNMIQGTPTIDSNNFWVYACIKGGSDGKNYYARFKTTWTKSLQPNQVIERDLLIEVKEQGF
jgi:hypothetical protein